MKGGKCQGHSFLYTIRISTWNMTRLNFWRLVSFSLSLMPSTHLLSLVYLFILFTWLHSEWTVKWCKDSHFSSLLLVAFLQLVNVLFALESSSYIIHLPVLYSRATGSARLAFDKINKRKMRRRRHWRIIDPYKIYFDARLRLFVLICSRGFLPSTFALSVYA